MLSQLPAQYALLGAVIAAFAVPCLVQTGRFFPSALGTRVSIEPLLGDGPVGSWIDRLFSATTIQYWTADWLIWLYVLIPLSLFMLRMCKRGRRALVTSVFLLLFFVARALFGLHEFNVQDRYVSFLWPIYALMIWDIGLAAVALAQNYLPHSIAFRRGLGVALVAVAFAWPVRSFQRQFAEHTDIADRVVVQPSRWMAANLPADARVCMESAGAIRLFTDLYLIDAVGLTTQHLKIQRGNFLDFLARQRVEYLFDHLHRVPMLEYCGAGERLMQWAPDVPIWGNQCLWRLHDVPSITLVNAGASSTLGGSSNPWYAFDNHREREVLERMPTGFWAPKTLPLTLEATWIEPAPVTACVMNLEGVTFREGRHVPVDYRWEMLRNGRWTGLPIIGEERNRLGDTSEAWSVSVRDGVEINGIRFHCTKTSGLLPPVILEIRLEQDNKPYVWHWPDPQTGALSLP